jgi:hypothetical protein
MLKNKGQVGLAFLAIIVMIAFSFILILVGIDALRLAIGVRTQVKISVDTLDKGSGVVALLQSKKDSMSYAEILGDLRAANAKDDIDEDLIQTLEKFNTYLAVYNETGGKIKEYGELSSQLNKKSAQIALPGRKIGRIDIL